MPEISKKIHEAVVITDLKTRQDAVLACSDKLTTNVFRFCEINNIKILKDLSLIGFPGTRPDRIPRAFSIHYPATGLRTGENAALILILLLGLNGLSINRHRGYRPTAFIRGSSIKS